MTPCRGLLDPGCASPCLAAKENKVISKKRVHVKNAIGGMKRFQILVNRLRNKSDFIKDTIIRLAAGLFKLKN